MNASLLLLEVIHSTYYMWIVHSWISATVLLSYSVSILQQQGSWSVWFP